MSEYYLAPRAVYIEWIDAETQGGPEWQCLEASKNFAQSRPPIMKTVGFVLHQDDAWISVTDTLGSAETSAVHRIPQGMVVKVRELMQEGNTYA